MAVKIITLDLDGTLMSPDHLTVSQENKDALRAAHEKGVKIAVATGRTLAIMGDVCTQVPQVDYIIHSNGAGVVDRKTGERLYSNLMSWDFSEKIIDFLNTKPCFYELYVDGKSYVQEDRAPYFITDVLPKEFIDAHLDDIVDFAERRDFMDMPLKNYSSGMIARFSARMLKKSPFTATILRRQRNCALISRA